MFDFGFDKLFIIGVVALVVIGPKDLPRVLRQVGQAIGKLRRMSSDFQRQFMDAMHEAELADLKAETEKLAQEARINVSYDPLREVKTHLEDAVRATPEARAEIPAEGPVKELAIESHLDAEVEAALSATAPSSEPDLVVKKTAAGA